MLIRALDIDEDVRKRMLLGDDEIYEISELPTMPEEEGGTGPRRFRIYQKDKHCGEIYEDHLDPKVLAHL